MKSRFLCGIILWCLSESLCFSFHHPKRFLVRTRSSVLFSTPDNEETLYNIDNQLEKAQQRMKILKKQKYSLVSLRMMCTLPLDEVDLFSKKERFYQ